MLPVDGLQRPHSANNDMIDWFEQTAIRALVKWSD